MAKAPAFQFYVRDWLSDPELRSASTTSRGIWIDVLCYMWMGTDKSGCLEITPCKLARLTSGGDLKEALHFLNDIWDTGFGDLEFDEEINFPIDEEHANTKITIINRRMRNEYLTRTGNKERQARYREKGGGDPDKWTSIRIKILQRDEYMCAYCGRKADTVDHIIPKSKGGDESDENLVACCKRCNMQKNNRTPEEAGMKFWKGYLTMKHQNNTKITPSSSSSSSSSSSKNNQQADFFKNKLSPYFESIEKTCKILDSTKPKKDFNPFAFVNKSIKSGIHPGAVDEILKSMVLYWEKIESPWAYSKTAIKKLDGNYWEKEHIKDHQFITQACNSFLESNKEIMRLVKGIGK